MKRETPGIVSGIPHSGLVPPLWFATSSSLGLLACLIGVTLPSLVAVASAAPTSAPMKPPVGTASAQKCERNPNFRCKGERSCGRTTSRGHLLKVWARKLSCKSARYVARRGINYPGPKGWRCHGADGEGICLRGRPRGDAYSDTLRLQHSRWVDLTNTL